MKKLGFGMMRLPLVDDGSEQNVDIEETRRLVDVFMKNGFTYFDTAYMYHNYKSEEILRETVVNSYPRESFTVADKLPTMFLKEAEDMPRIFDEQLRKCGVEYFDYYMLHSMTAEYYDGIVKRIGAFDFISEKKREGLVREIGFSFHDNADTLDRILSEHPEVDFVQLQINYLDWEDENIQSRKFYETARAHGKKIIIMEPVKGGTLANVSETAKTIFSAADSTMSVASWAVRYAASLDGVMMVLSGMSNMEQLHDNVGYMKDFCPLDDDELETVKNASAAIRGSVEIPCTGCGYCLEGCPRDISIPSYFALYNTEKLTGISRVKDYFEASKKHGKASDCIGCGKCESACPQHLKIREYLESVKKLFEK